MDERRDPPLNDTQATDVLRYWLGSMRYQEALAARPKAQRIEPGPADAVALVPNLMQPAPGRKYMKLDWAGREAFGPEFHLAALAELARVAREVQVFPLLAMDGRPSPHLAIVVAGLRRAGHRVVVERVGYEVLRGGDAMLRLHRER